MLTVLFICRGNTCRSAMAEGIARHLLGDAPVLVASAGLQAANGMRATPEAVAALRHMGIDIADHRAKRATEVMVAAAVVVYPMTAERSWHFETLFPAHRAKAQRLDPRGRDIPDPIGGDLADYITTAGAIEEAIALRLPEWR